jgi:pre-mRNA-splicing factor CWC22
VLHGGAPHGELRGTGETFGHLLATDAVAWLSVLGGVRITEEDTTSSSHIFIKVVFHKTAEQLEVRELGWRLNNDDPMVRDALFPRDSTENTQFAVNFFRAIGLSGVTGPARSLLLS